MIRSSAIDPFFLLASRMSRLKTLRTKATISPRTLSFSWTSVRRNRSFPGYSLMTQIGGMYHHPDYFDEPEIFKPERYLNSQHGTKEGVNTTGFRENLPFGAGRVGLITSILVSVCQIPNVYLNGFEFILAHLSRWRDGNEDYRTLFIFLPIYLLTLFLTQMFNTMNLLWAFNFVKDESGTGSWDIDSYPAVESLSFLIIDRIDNWSFTHSMASVARSLLLPHSHVPSLPEMRSAQISLSKCSRTMPVLNPFDSYIFLVFRAVSSNVLPGIQSLDNSLIIVVRFCRPTVWFCRPTYVLSQYLHESSLNEST